MTEETDQTANTEAPVEGTSAPTEPTFSAADVERILAADREQRASSEPDDPVAKFRATAAGTKLYKPASKTTQQPQPQQPATRMESLVESMIALQLAALKPPAPPAPPKAMSLDEKLASVDPEIWLRRGNTNQWTPADREQLVQRHRQQLAKEGFRGWIDQEADARATREISTAAQRALKDVRLTHSPAEALLAALGRGR